MVFDSYFPPAYSIPRKINCYGKMLTIDDASKTHRDRSISERSRLAVL